MTEVVAKVLPILLLIALGYLLQKKEFFSQETVGQLKKGIINIFLPAILFVTFLDMEVKMEYFLVFLISFLMLVLFYIVGLLLNKIKVLHHPLLPFIVTATTFGLLGLSLYETVFGSENLIKMSIFGVGHEIFIWFIYVTLLKIKLNKEKMNIKVIKDFITSPLIIALVLGIGLNLLGVKEFFHQQGLLKGIYSTMKSLAVVSTPLILIVVGYGLKLNPKYTKQSLKFIGIRLIVMFSIGYLFKALIFNGIMGQDTYFDYAYFTFLILPPPMSLAIFTEQFAGKQLGEEITNTLVLNTLICILLFIGFLFFVS